MFFKFLYSILLQMFMVQPLLAQEPIWVFEDTTASLSFEDVVAMPDAFVQTTDTNIGFSDSAFWIRVELTNDTDERQTPVVQFDSHVLSLIEAYDRSTNPSAVQYSGYSVSEHERPLSTILPSFPVEIESGRSSIQYFRITSPYQISLSSEVKTLNQAFTDSGWFETLRYGLALGLFILLAYNVATAVIVRQTVHWLYVGFVGLTLCAQLLELNIFSTPNSINFLAITSAAGLACGMGFLAILLGLLSSKWFRWCIAVFCFVSLSTMAVFDLSDAHQIIVNGVLPLGLMFLSTLVMTGVILQRPYSKLVFVGWTCFISGAVMTLMAIGGMLPPEYIPAYAIGSLLEATVFSIVLAYRLRDQDQTVALLDQQRKTNERQKELFAVVGHELRTPVAAISMIGRDTDTDAESKCTQIVEISENLLSVLEDLRVVVAPERALEAKFAEVCDPVRTISRALSPLSQLIKQHSVALRLNISKPEGVNFFLHAQPLRQLVTNLTKNAAIHSGGSVVQVSFNYQQLTDGSVVGSLTVEDDGKGIPESLREKVFEPFERGDTERDGSGLGLFISKEVASLLGGTLEYSISQLGGACFTLTFPMLKAEVEEKEKPQANNVSLEGLRILLAEDDAMLRMLTEKSLGKLGAQIASYDNGQKALAAFEADQFDLVLTDLMMPMMNGHELTKSLRDLGAKIPIIGVTAAVIGDETDEWLKDGANAFVSKPITPEKLQNALDTIGFTPSAAT